MIGDLVAQSAGVGIGIFLGTLIGLFARKRSGKTDGMLNGSVFLTASAAGGATLLMMMAINALM